MATSDQDMTASVNSGTAQSVPTEGSDQIQLAQAVPAAAGAGQNVVTVTSPAAGERVEIQVEAGQKIILQGIDLSTAQIQQVEGGLLITLASGAVIFLAGFVEAAQADNPPVIELVGLGGPALPGDQDSTGAPAEPAFGTATIAAADLLAAAQGATLDIAPAAGPGGDGGGSRFGSGDTPPIGDGLGRGPLLGNDDFFRGPPDPQFGESIDGDVGTDGNGGNGGGEPPEPPLPQVLECVFDPEDFNEILGTGKSDNLNGTPGDDIIFGLGGDDKLSSGKGDDVLDGGEGNDQLTGGQGDDIIIGGEGDDTFKGGEGDDCMHGGEGNDEFFAGEGADLMFGDAGDDTLKGAQGDDILIGGEGTDTLFGQQGTDVFVYENGDGNVVLALADVIGDFDTGEDFIGLADGLTFADLTITDDVGDGSGNAVIQVTGTSEYLATVTGVSQTDLNDASNFVEGYVIA